jgi:hypothetical protein
MRAPMRLLWLHALTSYLSLVRSICEEARCSATDGMENQTGNEREQLQLKFGGDAGIRTLDTALDRITV